MTLKCHFSASTVSICIVTEKFRYQQNRIGEFPTLGSVTPGARWQTRYTSDYDVWISVPKQYTIISEPRGHLPCPFCRHWIQQLNKRYAPSVNYIQSSHSNDGR